MSTERFGAKSDMSPSSGSAGKAEKKAEANQRTRALEGEGRARATTFEEILGGGRRVCRDKKRGVRSHPNISGVKVLFPREAPREALSSQAANPTPGGGRRPASSSLASEGPQLPLPSPGARRTHPPPGPSDHP